MMDKMDTFIKINDVRIKLGNIKNYGISETEAIGGQYRRKIWITDRINKAFIPNWQYYMSYDDYDHLDREYTEIDDTDTWKGYIDMYALEQEYKKLKEMAIKEGEEQKQANKKKNKFTSFFKNLSGDFGNIEEKLSTQEAVFEISENEMLDSYNTFLTRGKLYFNGRILRCTGSPYEGARNVRIPSKAPNVLLDTRHKEVCFQDRILEHEEELIRTGELCRTNLAITNSRFLYITTYQNDNFQFGDQECAIDEIINKIDNTLAL